jgi:hypothetical protein
MQKYLNRLLIATFLANLLFLGSLALNIHSAHAAAKKVYKAEVVTGTSGVQSMLDQRAAEGWRLVSASGYAYPNGTNTEAVTVLIFEKE